MRKKLSSERRRTTGIKFAARALRHRNYRLFFSGQGISLIGTWMQQVAMSWLVYRLTGSPYYLGLVGFTGQIPTFLLSPFAGVLADRFDRRHLLIITQTLAMVQAFLMAALALTGRAEVWHIIALSVALGCVNAFDVPIRQSFFVDIVANRKDLGNAIALNSFIFNGARLAGPSVAGFVIGIAGEGPCFLLNGISFFAVVAALLLVKVTRKKIVEVHPPVLQGLKEGYIYAFNFLPIRYILLHIGLLSLIGIPYIVLLPIFAKDVLHGGALTLGFLTGAAGAGALVGALYLASRRTVLGLGKLIPLAAFIFGMSLIAFAFSRHAMLSVVLMFAAGFGILVQNTSCNTIVQTIVEEDKRGRVMSFYAVAFLGMAPFGNLLAGVLAGRIGAPITLIMSGLLCIGGGFLFYSHLPMMRRLIRPIYVKMGIIRETPAEIQ